MNVRLDEIELQPTSLEVWSTKYQLKDRDGNPIDQSIDDSYVRVATALASNEVDSDYWFDQYKWVLDYATPAGRILSNAGAEKYKPATSLINCTVSQAVEDSMPGIMEACKQAAITLASGAGIGYEFSTLRPKGAFVGGAGAFTSGPLSFMNIFDSMCFTVSSAGGRRGAQMATFAVWHPNVEDFIKSKREDGALRQFNLSLLITNEFMDAVKTDGDWDLFFPLMKNETSDNTIWKPLFWNEQYCLSQNYTVKDNQILCRVYKTVKAQDLWDTIMNSTYNFAEPGFLLVDQINQLNNNYFCENIRATNPCVAGDTIVETQKGSIRIDELVSRFAEGEKFLVKSMNVDTGETVFATVSDAFLTRENEETLELILDSGQTIRCTKDHKVFTSNRGYVEAQYLTENDDIVTD